MAVSAHTLAEDRGQSLGLQAEYGRSVVSTESIDGPTVGAIDYLFACTVKGRIETTHHVEVILAGQPGRYHVDFWAPEAQFESGRAQFEEMAESFRYLKGTPQFREPCQPRHSGREDNAS